MDARAMEFKDNSFDCVLDKATFDSILVNPTLTALHSTALSRFWELVLVPMVPVL